MKKRALSLSMVCAALLSANEQKLNEIVVTASGHEQTIKTAPATVNVVDQKEIKHIQVRQLGDLVESVPGISTEVEKTGTKGIQIRGFSKHYTLLLVDGKKITMDPGFDGNGFDATGGFIPPASLIERVEIVKGPAGGKYASEAIGGVINVITKKPEQTMAGIKLETTLQESSRWGNIYGADAFVAHPFNDKLSALFYLGYQEGSKNNLTWDIVPNYKPARNSYNPYLGWAQGGYLNYKMGAKINYKINDENEVYLEQNYNYQRLNSLNTSVNNFTAIREYRRYNAVIGHEGEYDIGKFSSYFQYMNSRRYTHDTSSSRIDSNGKKHYLNAIGDKKGNVDKNSLIEDQVFVFQSAWERDFEVFDGSTLILSAGPYFSYEKLYNRTQRGQTYENGKSRTPKNTYLAAIFGEGEMLWNDYISTTLGLRFNHVKEFGSYINPRAYVNIYPNEWLTLKAGISSGFKAPTLAQRLENGLISQSVTRGTSTTQYGNVNLKPEKSLNYEIGAIIDGDIGYISATAFYSDFKDKINNRDYEKGSILPNNYGVCYDDSCRVYENVDTAEIKGFEIDAKIKSFSMASLPGSFNASFGYGYNNTKQKSGINEGAPLNSVPTHKISAKLGYELGSFDAFIRYTANLKTPVDTTIKPSATALKIGKHYKNYNVVDLGLGYEIKKDLSVRLGINNLFDTNFEKYAIVNGSATNEYQKAVARRNYNLSISAQF